MRTDISEFPFDQFKLLGIEKTQVTSLPKAELNALQSGNRTSVMQFANIKLQENGDPVTVNAKLSIENDGIIEPRLKLHPINIAPVNNLDLSRKEMTYLQKDAANVISKMVLNQKGTLEDSFVSFDRLTNEFVAIKRESLKAPESVNTVKLTDQQKDDFVKGKPIKIGKQNLSLDINSNNGLSSDGLNLTFKSGKYTAANVLADVAIVSAGLAPIVLVEHLSKMLVRNVAGNVYDNRKQLQKLLGTDLRPVLTKTVQVISDAAQKGRKLTSQEKNELLVFNVQETLSAAEEKSRNQDDHRITDESKNSDVLVDTLDHETSRSKTEVAKTLKVQPEELVPDIQLPDSKEDIQLKLDELKDSYDSKGYFTDLEQDENAALLDRYNSIDTERDIDSANRNRTEITTLANSENQHPVALSQSTTADTSTKQKGQKLH